LLIGGASWVEPVVLTPLLGEGEKPPDKAIVPTITPIIAIDAIIDIMITLRFCFAATCA
jgi:hypothetical protein